MCTTCTPLFSKLQQKLKGYSEIMSGNNNDYKFGSLQEPEAETEWWRASKEDGFDVQRKLQRVGCRPIYRQYMNCTRSNQDDQFQCQSKKEELDRCLQMLQYVQATKPDL